VRRNSIGLDLSRATWGGGLVVAGKGAYLDMVDCEISENQSRGAGGGLFIDDEADALVKNTLVRANGCSVDDQGLGAGIYVDGLDRGTGSSATFENIVVVDHDCHPYSTVGVALYAEKDSTVIIRNSIFRNNVNSEGSSQFVVQTGSVVTVSYSNVQGGLTGSGNIQSGGGNIDADPMFVNPAAGDYHLKPGSRCIDSGWPSSPYDQEPAPNGGRINMGMYGNTAEATQS